MDETIKPVEEGNLPLQGPHWHRGPEQAELPEFVPLRLRMPTSGFSVDISRPDVLVGRHTEADVRFPLPDISRRHCRILFSEGSWQILDLNSLNGVFVNNVKVQRALLHHRDVIGIGGFTFEVELGANSQTVPLSEGTPQHTHEILQSIVNALPPSPEDSSQQRRRAS